MFNISFMQHTLPRLLCAATLALAASAAVAGPSYHVDIDTAALAGQSGYLDFSVIGTLGAPSARATFTNFTSALGNYGIESDRVGAVLGGIPAGFSLANAAGDNYLTHAISFGGLYGFDVSFSGDYQSVSSPDGASFAVGLYNASFTDYQQQARFDVQPAFGTSGASVTPFALGAGVSIAALNTSPVPEPASWAMMLTGLFVTGAIARRRRR